MNQIFQGVVRRWSAWLDRQMHRQFAALHAGSRPQARMLALRSTEPDVRSPGGIEARTPDRSRHS